MAQEIVLSLFRFNPAVDAGPRFDTHRVAWRPHMSVLELLRIVHEEHAPLSFDYICRGATCGMCSMRVNGEPVLACVTPVPPGDIRVEPLAGFRVVKDLIVDRAEVDARLHGTMPWFSRIRPMTAPLAMPPAAYVRTAVLQLCKDCLCCHSACPVVEGSGFDTFVGPFILTKIAMRYFDTRDDFADQRLKTAVREGLFNCISCGRCDEVCPRGKLVEVAGYPEGSIQHVRVFTEMMRHAEEKGWKP